MACARRRGTCRTCPKEEKVQRCVEKQVCRVLVPQTASSGCTALQAVFCTLRDKGSTLPRTGTAAGQLSLTFHSHSQRLPAAGTSVCLLGLCHQPHVEVHTNPFPSPGQGHTLDFLVSCQCAHHEDPGRSTSAVAVTCANRGMIPRHSSVQNGAAMCKGGVVANCTTAHACNACLGRGPYEIKVPTTACAERLCARPQVSPELTLSALGPPETRVPGAFEPARKLVVSLSIPVHAHRALSKAETGLVKALTNMIDRLTGAVPSARSSLQVRQAHAQTRVLR
eukprot:1150633-Pelagomonas_calceolata.AAC.8